MISPEYLSTMAQYNAEMNKRMYLAALKLSDTERRSDQGAFFKSIHSTLAHILWADQIWMARFGLGEAPSTPIQESGTDTGRFEDLWDRRHRFDQDIVTWSRNVSPDDIAGELEWWSGSVQKHIKKSKALCLMQVFNHQTHHRGQVHALLTRAGQATGDTDLPFVL